VEQRCPIQVPQKLRSPSTTISATTFSDYFSIANVITRVLCMAKSPILSKQLSNGNSITTFIRRGPDGAARVLDIGCGWGALQKRLVEQHRVKLAVGLTLSENQAEWIRAMSLPGAEARVESCSDHVAVAPAQRGFGRLAAGSHR
jgi:hypothetical protein